MSEGRVFFLSKHEGKKTITKGEKSARDMFTLGEKYVMGSLMNVILQGFYV